MGNSYFELESFKLFSESQIWQFNRDFYQEVGIDAWAKSLVPYHLTTNSLVGKTYAELILGFLTDLAAKGNSTDIVYILELGAGHGRLAYHTLHHLERLKSLVNIKLPPYCYILSDIVEDNLLFFKEHPQLQTYFKQGVLDFSYFDGVESKEIHLQYADTKICPKDLEQPIIAIANYFFDSIPNDLFLVKDKTLSACSIAIQSKENPKEIDTQALMEGLELIYQKTLLSKPFYSDSVLNELLEEYKNTLTETHLFFPHKSLQCINNLMELSNKGLMLLTMDKGFHELHDLDKKEEPELIIHNGCFSLWVNFHAFGKFCEKKGGKVLFPSFLSNHSEVGCLLFLDKGDSYAYTNAAYHKFVENFGPDDFHTIKNLAYQNLSKLTLSELVALIRLSCYDPIFFVQLLGQIKKLYTRISFNERKTIAQILHKVWDGYYNINDSYDLAYELAGIFFDLGFYEDALIYFQYAVDFYGAKADIYHNQILCYYQLRKDDLFIKVLKEAKIAFPNSTLFERLDKLDLTAT